MIANDQQKPALTSHAIFLSGVRYDSDSGMGRASRLVVSIASIPNSDNHQGYAQGAVAPAPRAMPVPPRPESCDRAGPLSFGDYLQGRNRADRASQVDAWHPQQRSNRGPSATLSSSNSATDHNRPRLLPKLGEITAVKPEPRVQQTVKVEQLERRFATGRLIDVIA